MNDEELIKTIKEKDRENDRLMDLLEKSIQVNEKINKRYLIRSYVTGLMIFLVVIAWIIGYYSIPSISRYSINNNNGDASNPTINIKDGE